MEYSTHTGPTLERGMTGPRTVVAMLMVLAVMAALGSIAFAGGSVPDTQWSRGGTSDIPGVRGVIELFLFDNGSGGAMLKAMGKAEGDGLTDNALYSLWLADQKGNLVLLDSGRADEDCEEDPDTGKETDDCEIELRLRTDLQPAPFQVTSLLDLTATIRESAGNIVAPVVVTFTVTEADLLIDD